MKKRLCLSTAALTLLSPFAAFADDPTGPTVWDGFSGWLSPDWRRDFSATAGVKIWINDWDRASFLGANLVDDTESLIVSTTDTGADNQESDIEPVPIPQISARYKWLFVTGSYYAKTGFDFDDSETVVQVGILDGDCVLDPCVQSVSTVSTSADRYEWDASGGVYIHPYVAILGGYKKVRQEVDFFTTQTTDDFVTGARRIDTARSFSDIDIEGPTIGIAGSVPIGRGFGMYASYAHGFMEATIRDVLREPFDQELSSGEFDATYDVAELGFSYTHGTEGLAPHMPLSAATVYAGYRYQNISTEFDQPKQDRFVGAPGQDRSDVTKGFAVGVNFTF